MSRACSRRRMNMSFLDKAKLAATGLAAKADGALSNAGLSGGAPPSSGNRDADRLFRDLGVLAYRHAQGNPSPEAYERAFSALRQLEATGQLGNVFTSEETPPPPPPPPPPGAAAAAAAPPAPGVAGQQTLPPPSSPAPTPAPSPPQSSPTDSGGGSVPPPPPPSWASNA
jgi:hypothetical protein